MNNTTPLEEPYAPRAPRDLIVYYDELGLQKPAVELADTHPDDPDTWTRAIEDLIRVHAEAQVSAISKVVWSRFTHTLHPDVSKTTVPNYAPRPEDDEHSLSTVTGAALDRAFHEAGRDAIQVMMDQARRDGIAFIAALRMNDRHPIAMRERAWLDHPDWRLDLGRTGTYWEGGFDYAVPEVRQQVLVFIEELLDHYDVDGIELDWMRWVHVFKPDRAARCAPLLTEFHRAVRHRLDEASKKRGRRLRLGVRVPTILDRCLDLGFDVAAWVAEDLLDYVVPSHFGNLDFNAPIERYRQLTEGRSCRVYPSLQGHRWTGPCRLEEYRREHYRAAAHNWLAGGADGIEVYNYQFKTFEQIAARVPDLVGLADPSLLARCDRDYLYWRARGDIVAAGPPAMQYDVIRLDRASAAPAGRFTFRLAADTTDSRTTATMSFKAVGIRADERLEVSINDRPIPADAIRRVHVWDGRGPADVKPGPREPYDLVRFALSAPPVVFADNQLEVALAEKTAPKGVIRVEEVSVRIEMR